MTISDEHQIQGSARGFVPGTAPASMSCTPFLITRHFAPLPSDLTKLVRVASMFDRASGRYVEPDAARRFGEELVDSELRDLHLSFFRAWLSHTLEDQIREFDSCGPPQTEARATLLEWASNDGERLIPPGAMKAERMLFQYDLSIVLYVLCATAPNRRRASLLKFPTAECESGWL